MASNDLEPAYMPALERALVLRLKVLGHLGSPPLSGLDAAARRSALRRGTASFGSFLSALGVPTPGALTRAELWSWLTDHVAQLRLLAEALDASGPTLDEELLPRAMDLARVELWMQDHDVRDLQKPPGRKLWARLRDSRRGWRLPVAPRRRRLDGALVRRWLRDAEGPVLDPTDSLAEQTVLDAVALSNPSHFADAWGEALHRRHSLWDGARRASAWLGRAVRRGLDVLVRAIRSSVRALTRTIRWLYRRGCLVLDGIQAAMGSLVRAMRPLHTPDGASCLRADFDVDVIYIGDPSGHAARLHELLHAVPVAADIVGWLVDLIAATTGQGWRWIRVVRELVQLLPRLEALGRAQTVLSPQP